MSRRMSCAMTVDAVLTRTKTVTRRHVDTWKTLKPGDHLTLIEKGMGLKKGEKQRVLAEVEVVDVRVESILDIDNEGDQGTAREGFAGMSKPAFVQFWLNGHGYQWPTQAADVLCRRIEWRYLP